MKTLIQLTKNPATTQVHQTPRKWLQESPSWTDQERRLDNEAKSNYVAGPAVLTHGGLSANNTMADGDKVTAIIDWETAAWMPDYWEYANTWFVNPCNPYWQEEVPMFLEKYLVGFEMEMLRR
ncbi:hypothetical protein SBRCBS47491_007509 [Sporothrix bragantina]|uniref:Aminoglycoside phosphotransferase domain-containing protein n=1 Tax=Sporothrix bragantina TaxID=671064 RepID=A0ABP0CGJ4_9PEZI